MLNFEVYTVEKDSELEYGPKKGDIRVKFPEQDLDFCTELDEAGRRYFHIPNTYTKGNSRIDYLFSDCIKDAVMSIRAGYGDAISLSSLFGGKIISVFYFLDRVYGETLRQKSLEGWKNTEFKWTLTHKHNPICSDNTLYTPFFKKEKQASIVYYETEAEANAELSRLEALVREKVDKYFTLTEDEKSDYLDTVFESFDIHSVLSTLFLDMCESREDSTKYIGLKVAQAAIANKV